MKIQKTYKFRIYPSKTNKSQLNKTFGCSRFIYNQMLQEIKSGNKRPTEAQLKIKHPFLKDVDSIALQQSRINLQTAFKNFKEKRSGFPVFKSRKSRQSFRTVSTNENIKIDFSNNTLKLPKISPIKFKDKRNFTSPIRQVTISKNTKNQYFASILIEEDIFPKKVENFNGNNTIGVDMGLAQIVTYSDGTKVDSLRLLSNYQKKLRKVQRRFSKTKKGSKRRERLRLKLGALHIKIRNIRKDFLHKLSNLIIKNYSGICVEDLNIKGMLKNRRLAKSVSDLGWSEFIRILEYKCLWTGKTLLKAGRFFPSSKLCHYCHYKNDKLKLSDRMWTCPECGASHDRDLNAAINLKDYFFSTLGTRGFKAGGDDIGLKLAFASNAIVNETRSSIL